MIVITRHYTQIAIFSTTKCLLANTRTYLLPIFFSSYLEKNLITVLHVCKRVSYSSRSSLTVCQVAADLEVPHFNRCKNHQLEEDQWQIQKYCR